jgi:hypothetical protein
MKTGRPEFQPTQTMRQWVVIAAAAATAHEEIALGLGISRGTLRRHFAQEFGVVACRRRMDIVCAMYAAATGGSVAAMKAYLARASTVSRRTPREFGAFRTRTRPRPG